jgi:hypothetical protein
MFVGFLACLMLGAATLVNQTVAEDKPSNAAKPVPVDDDMHHFMEYVFEPNYKRLKVGLATEPKDKSAWKAVKGDALTLAEGANLLLSRAPKEKADVWRKLSVDVRTYGGDVYQAARKSDFATARKCYVAMLRCCNSCHKQFADGEHQLKP